MKRVVFAFVSLLSPLTLLAQSSADQAEIIRLLQARVEVLEKRLEQLEARQPAAAPAAAAEVVATPPAAAHHEIPVEPPPSYPWLKVGGFGDLNFSASDIPGTRSGFTEGQFVLHFSSTLSPKVSFFGEVSFTARPDAGIGSPAPAGFNPEIERSIVRLDQSDRLKVSFGRYHTPVNWWNATFHHGQWLQTTVDRPEMIRFGGQLLPIHFVGALLEGTLPAGGANLNYNFGVGNGRSGVISRAGDAGDVNNHRAWLANVFVRPDPAPALQIGGSIYRDKLVAAGNRDFREWIAAAHAVWVREKPELIAEFANVNHKEVRGGTAFNTQAFYIQAAYRLNWLQEAFKPYYRFEYISVDRADPIFRLLPDLKGSFLGVRYDLSPFAALKAEYRSQRRTGQSRANIGLMQISFTF